MTVIQSSLRLPTEERIVNRAKDELEKENSSDAEEDRDPSRTEGKADAKEEILEAAQRKDGVHITCHSENSNPSCT